MQTLKPILLFTLFGLAECCAYGQNQSDSARRTDTIAMKTDSLQAAIVTAVLKPRMKGDTLEYNTRNFRVQRNGAIEEMLRRLPGLQVDQNGVITYNGEIIQNLLVDGEDIFSTDPKMVTRNFDANKIARVQIINRKSDQAVFTGVDDGARTKTINLVLKESAKEGYFGNAGAGGNTGGYHAVNAALAAFHSKEQFTILGLSSNTGVLGMANNSGTSVGFLNGGTDPLGASAGVGTPQFTAAALHYADTWRKGDDHLLGNYQYGHFFTQPVTATRSLQMQPDGEYRLSQESQSINEQDQHRLYGVYDLNVNKRSAFKFAFHASNTQGVNCFNASGGSAFNDTVANESQRTINDKVSQRNIGTEIGLKTQMGNQPSRLLSASIGATKYDNLTEGFLYSTNNFYQRTGSLLIKDTVDQRKQIAVRAVSATSSINFVEPLWKDAALAFSYWASLINTQSLEATLDRGDGKYQQAVDSLSSNLSGQLIKQKATVNLQGKSKQIIYTVGNDWVAYRYNQRDMSSGGLTHLRYFNWSPRVFLNFVLNQNINFGINYISASQQPTPSQLEPLKNNSDPLHILVGNANLRPSINHNVDIEFRSLKTWLVIFNVNLALTSNSISNKTITDSLGRQVSQWVNVSGGRTTGADFSINKTIRGFNAGLHTAVAFSRTPNYLNTELNQNDAYTGEAGILLSKYVADKYSLQLNSKFKYFEQTSSVNPEVRVRYWSQDHQGSVSLFFVRNLEINTNAVYTWQEKTAAFNENTSVLLWNASISRMLIHDKLVVKFQYNNILNATSGFTHSNVANVSSEALTNILGRYWMLSASYHFDRKFKRKDM